MKRVLNYIFPALLVIVGVITLSSQESKASQFTEGVHYGVIEPALSTQADDGKVEVAEIFWYGCPHCYHLEPTIHEYLKSKPDNVSFARVPAMISPNWVFHGKVYYIGQMLDPEGKKDVHTKIFEAIHKQRRRIDKDDQMKRFFKGLGFSDKEINNAMQSMELQGKLAYAREFSAKSGVDSVPAIVVHGKYITSPSMVSGKKMIDAINFLTQKAAAEMQQ